ncbi:gliding motility-associated C-terminal domain-containing protein [Myroides odoratus]|uniref:Gliding motility-associated C-terminal domain-containing protein n=1 Tax=Myroides odoratus TaxID=256 RepID=A0A9Q7EBL9_MYROD|nr:gliding motility-associated C-terminal domain-containing protein [Myroides odoratus]EHQ44220.1 hypothetical protein Myrod_3414 [Myroides odoratus DSM 2801]EKB05841.1 hypothetical protein HMPREF9716_02679 [Myroides odoratus CIP 103059]QQU01504.1 gliding motility-associated C-terminal domain-containing protein [Myroides odoratus]WQD56227.1 gliding motility-associated C-terminal domain-containing protein [Myroides odoratus]STZ31536.1 gliding motility-associated C-terminal domain [Myroides odor
MKKNYKYLIILTLCSSIVLAQENESEHFINVGQFMVAEGTILSSDYMFENSPTGNFENKGKIYYYNDFKNDNLFYSSGLVKDATVLFSSKDVKKRIQISGQKPIEFQNVEFEHINSDLGFMLSNEISVKGNSNFISGIIEVIEKKGMFTFLNNSNALNASDLSHVRGAVEKQGSQNFVFPIGEGGFFRPAMISAPKDIQDVVVAQYRLNDTPFFENHKSTTGAIKKLNDKEYWKLDAKLKSKETVILSLTWDDRTTPSDLLKNPEDELHIVRWDDKQQLWVDEGGVVDMSTKTVTTPTTIKDFGFFTLAAVKRDWILDGDVVIYNLVTPDGDGKNDYFIIDNIQKYPNNRVEIYNRWGIKVFETTGYDPNGDGSSNVFTGYSEGKITVDKSKKLPSGTYYYVVTYEYKDDNGSRMIKKAANLHLETN